MILEPVGMETVGVKTGLDKLRAQHDSWMVEMSMRGWCWGPEIDEEKKQHPQFMPFDDFMDSLRNK